jgi:hypothetical protein
MSGNGCKVCRVLEDYEMERYEEQLLDHWQADSPQRKGYRQLADWLNTLMLRREMDRSGLSTLGDEAKSKYERLQSDDSIAREVAMELSNKGVPIERLQKDFVSYGVIRTHLKDCLSAEVELSSSDWEQDSIEIAQGHAESKAEEAIRSLQTKGDITSGGDLDISVTVEVECDNCHSRIPAQRALRRGYVCKCGDT